MKSLPLLPTFFMLLFFSACQQNSPNPPTSEIEDIGKLQGIYTHSYFQSPSRGKVAYNVYLPPTWTKEDKEKYPLVVFMHGQGENEFKFPDVLITDSLNSWMTKGFLPEMVLIALRGGKNTNKMQWYSDANVKMLTSENEGELMDYCHKNFNTALDKNKISIVGHSRGATGALNLALNFPDQFAAVISSAFVSDYALDKLQKATITNLKTLKESKTPIKMLIGTKDQYADNYGRSGSYQLSDFFKKQDISHDLEILEGATHSISDIWTAERSLRYLQFCSKNW